MYAQKYLYRARSHNDKYTYKYPENTPRCNLKFDQTHPCIVTPCSAYNTLPQFHNTPRNGVCLFENRPGDTRNKSKKNTVHWQQA